MAQTERTGQRDLSYSIWHRSKSIGRFLDGLDSDRHRPRVSEGPWCEYPDNYKRNIADQMGMIDIDFVLHHGKHFTDRKPVALIETARTFYETVSDKKATMTRLLGEAAKIPVFVVLYQCSEVHRNPADMQYPDIDWFFVRPYWPVQQDRYFQMTPRQYAWFLVSLRRERGSNIWQPPLHPAWPLVDDADIAKLTFYEAEKEIKW